MYGWKIKKEELQQFILMGWTPLKKRKNKTLK